MTLDKNRCVVTGLGVISAIGNNVEECWNSVIHSVSGIEKTTTVDTEGCYANLAAEVKDDTLNHIPHSENMDRVSKLCLKASLEALEDAGLKTFNFSNRVSVIMGSCVGGAVSIEEYFKNGKDANVVAQMPISAIASQVASVVEAGGVVTNVANACAAGTISIAYACDLIRAGKADIVIAGGADAFASVPYSGFLALHALDANPCSPFNHCTGITLGEGAGCVIVESYEHAMKRKAHLYCEILGSGVSSDAHHITAPRPDGEGQMNAIHKAIKNSGIRYDEIGYINAHGTGTAKNDEAEFLSLHTIFDGKNDQLSVSSTKAMVGHCLGAAGAIEAVFTIKALTENIVPATLHYSEEDLEKLKTKALDIDFVANQAHPKSLETVMSNSFAFGGNNASIVFSKHAGQVDVEEDSDAVCITGFGVVSPLGNGIQTYIEQVNKGVRPAESSVFSSVGLEDYDKLGLKMAFYRKLDNFSQLQAVSGMDALKHANLTVSDSNATDIGIVIGTSEGALGTSCLFEENIAEHGNANGSAFKFPNTVYNAAGGYLSICSGIKGYNVTITNGAQSGLASVAYATNILKQKQEKIVLATGTDENIDIIHELYDKLGYISADVALPYENKEGFTLADGSTTIVLESEASAKERNATVYGKVLGYGMAHQGVAFGTISGSKDGLTKAITEALKDAKLSSDQIDAVFGFADGFNVLDEIEKSAYKDIFGSSLENLAVVQMKEHTGEGRAASASLACVHALLMMDGSIVEDHAYFIGPDKITKRRVSGKNWQYALVTSFGSGGTYCAVIIAKK